MDTIDRPNRVVLDPPEVVWAQIKKRRWRLVRRIAIAAILAAIIVAAQFVVRYQPLEIGNVSACGGATQPTAFGRSQCVPVYASGGVFLYGFEIVNRGPIPVTITGIPSPAATFLFTDIEVLTHTNNDPTRSIDERRAEPFRPVRLGRDQRLVIFFRQRFRSCGEIQPGFGTSWADQPIRIRYGFLAKTIRMPMPEGVLISVPENACAG